jgi:hypothetical protein
MTRQEGEAEEEGQNIWSLTNIIYEFSYHSLHYQACTDSKIIKTVNFSHIIWLLGQKADAVQGI